MLEQKRLENHEIYYIGAAELPLKFTHCAPLLGWRYLYPVHSVAQYRAEEILTIFGSYFGRNDDFMNSY